MNKIIYYLFGMALCLNTALCFSQNKLVSVNTATGTANVVIPLYNLSYGGVSVPVALSYSAGGIKPKDVEGSAGMGWNVMAGGSVSRVVRGLPDDCTHDAFNNPVYGWINNLSQGFINAFAIANNGSTCSNETTDINYITTYFPNNYDTEPDIFSVSAPGLSCSLVYDHNISNFRPVPYQDLKITYTTADSAITSFTIINDKGIKYVFSVLGTAVQYTNQPASPMNFFANFYNQYKNFIDYTSNWYLTAMTDVNGQGAMFTYTACPSRAGSDPVRLYIGGSNSPTLEYNVISSYAPKVLSTITMTDDDVIGPASPKVTFSWNIPDSGATGMPFVAGISGLGRTIQFVYGQSFYYLNPSGYSREFLRNLSETGCSSPVNYTFSYAGETETDSEFHYYNTTLADSASKKFDYWGYNSSVKDSIPKLYVNPSDTSYQIYTVAANSSPGSNYPYTVGMSQASVDTVAVLAGTLDTIRYASGGMTTLTYQSNDYYDIPSASVIKGGGIRIKQIVDHDGVNEANDITRNYSYNNPSTGAASSGKPTSLPAYGFTMPYSGGATGQTLWTDATVIADADLSSEDHTILYAYVRETQTHAGSVLYQYYLPATNWDKTAVPGCSGCATVDWRPTTDYVGRTNCAATYGPVKNYTWSYPFAPNDNYDFERGLLQSMITYNDAGTKVSESDYTYQRSYSAVTAIPCLHFDYNGGTSGVLGYGKYNTYTSTSELTSTVTNTVFDSPTLSQSQVSTVNYAYTSANHKLLTRQSTTNSDGTTLITNVKYSKDYGAASSSNANINALYNLVLENVNVPVETWSQTQSGSNTYTTAAALTLFSNFSGAYGTLYLPSQQYKLTLPNGETSFTPSYISGTSFNKDAGYQPLPVNFDSYDFDGSLMTTDDSRHHVQSAVTNHYPEKTTLTVTNAAYSEFAFQNFDTEGTTPYLYFSPAGGTVAGRTGYGATISTSQTISSPAISRNAQANNYIFSLWLNSGTVTGSMSLTIKVTISGTTTTYTKTFTAPGNNWQYYEWKLPVSGTSFTVTAQPSANITADDILCYPETSEATLYSFDPTTTLPTSVTNTNGIATYYTYDVWGRLLYTFDRFKNILQKNTYVEDQKAFQTGYLSPSRINVYVDTSFYLTTANNSCLTGQHNTYIWNFNDGSGNFTTTLPASPVHTYDTVKTYNPTVQVISPVYGTQTFTTPIAVTIPLPTNVPVSFNNYANSHGLADLSSVQFYQGSTLVYSFSPATSLGTVLSGSYTIKVNMTSHASAYGSIELTTPNGKLPTVVGCANYSGSGAVTYTYSVTLPLNCAGLSILEEGAACSGGGD